MLEQLLLTQLALNVERWIRIDIQYCNPVQFSVMLLTSRVVHTMCNLCKLRLGWSRCWPPTSVSVTDSAVVLYPATVLGHQDPTQILGPSIFLANMRLIWLGDPFKILQSPFSKQVYPSCRSHRKGWFLQTQFWSVMVILQKVWGHGFPANTFIFPGNPTEIVGSHFLSMLIPGKLRGHVLQVGMLLTCPLRTVQSSWLLFWGKRLIHPTSSAGVRVVASVPQPDDTGWS